MQTKKTVLIVEDEADLSELVRFNLEKEGYKCRCAFDGTAAVAEISAQAPDLIILDRMLPNMSGDEVITKIKRDASTRSIPVIMLTAKSEESDEIVGLTLGADDYIRKPFSNKLLVARVAALLRRSNSPVTSEDRLTAGPIDLNQARHEVKVNAELIPLTTTEFRILQTLILASGRVLSREQLIDSVLGTMVAVTDRTIDVHIAALRKKLGSAAGWIQTVRGVGYTLRSPN